MAGVNLFCFPVLFGLCLIWPIQVYFGSLNYFPLIVACEADSPCQGIGLARPNSRARPAHARNQSYCAKHGSGHRALWPSVLKIIEDILIWSWTWSRKKKYAIWKILWAYVALKSHFKTLASPLRWCSAATWQIDRPNSKRVQSELIASQHMNGYCKPCLDSKKNLAKNIISNI